MPTIHKNLLFDHLYFSVNDAEFEEIKQIFTRFECVSHSVTKAEDDSWEGVYLYYYQRDSQKMTTFDPYEISRLTEVHFSVNPNLLEKIKLNTSWMNSKISLNDERLLASA